MADKSESTPSPKGTPRVVDAGADALLHGADRAKEAFERGVDGFKRGTLRARDGVSSAVETAEDALDAAREHYDDLRDRPLGELIEDVSDMVRRNPGKALLVSGLVGFVLGSLFSRRS